MPMARDRPVKIMMVGDLKDSLDALLERKRMSLTDAFEGMTRFLLEQDSIAQSLVLGQIEQKDRADLARVVLQRMAAEGDDDGGGGGPPVKETYHSGRRSPSGR
jgi:hypothetical protein